MKKYVKPNAMVIEVSNEELLAGSFGSANDTEGYSGRTGGFARQRGDSYEDEEDEDWDF